MSESSGPSKEDCPRAKSDMTPCVVRDGPVAFSDDGHCVGCGLHHNSKELKQSAPDLVRDGEKQEPRALSAEDALTAAQEAARELWDSVARFRTDKMPITSRDRLNAAISRLAEALEAETLGHHGLHPLCEALRKGNASLREEVEKANQVARDMRARGDTLAAKVRELEIVYRNWPWVQREVERLKGEG